MSKRVTSKSNVLGFDDRAVGVFQQSKSNGASLSFTRKNVYSTKNNPLCGITFFTWLKMLFKFGHWIELKYYFRVLFISVLSMINLVLSWVEAWKYSALIEAVDLPDDPVFIVGHPRTGTTLVHNLLSSDHDNFFYCSTFCAGFPSAFLWFEKFGKKLFASAMEKTRPMDSMPLHFDLPQEDELATNMLSGGYSYYMPLWFMKQEPFFRRYLNFSSDDGATAEDEEQWTSSFLYMMKKLCLRNDLMRQDQDQTVSTASSTRALSPGKQRLLLKSPVHTARIPLLRRLFPRATFVYIHRHPDEVLLSMAHMLDTTYWFCYLNTPSDEQIQEFILWQFEHMWYKYNDAVLSKGTTRGEHGGDRAPTRPLTEDVLEIGYANTTAHLKDTIKDIYSHVGIPWTDKLERHYLAEEGLLASYRPNVHDEELLSEDLRRLVRDRWGAYFDAFGYK